MTHQPGVFVPLRALFLVLNAMILHVSFQTDRSWQTVQTQIRLLLDRSGSSLFAIPFASFSYSLEI